MVGKRKLLKEISMMVTFDTSFNHLDSLESRLNFLENSSILVDCDSPTQKLKVDIHKKSVFIAPENKSVRYYNMEKVEGGEIGYEGNCVQITNNNIYYFFYTESGKRS